MSRIGREIAACMEIVHRQCCVSRATAVLALAWAFAAGAAVAVWFTILIS